jgi:CheY-like chemotaxis protein
MKQSTRVLLIDDEEAIVRVIGDVLQCFGYQVTVATSAQEGLRSASAWLPDAVVCDMRMPELGGEEVVLMLKAQPATAQIPIVLVSGYCEPSFAHLADAFLQKPFVVNELSTIILELLATRRACTRAA